MMLSLFSRSFFLAVVGSLDQLSESRDEEVVERAKPCLKAITTAVFGEPRSYQCYTETY